MTLHLPTRRAAEDFARALEGTATTEVARAYAPLVATATLMREQPTPAPRPEFVSQLRAELMAAAETELVPTLRVVGSTRTPSPARSRIRERHLGAAAAAAVLVATTAGVAAAAEGSLPGDTLYPVKRGIEQLQVAMNSNDAARGAEHLDLASTRLAEVEELLSSGGSSEQVESTLAAYSEHADEGSRLMFRSYQSNDNADDVATVREFTTSQVRQLAEIVDLAPAASVDEFGEVADLLSDIDQQARVLCGDCSGAAPVAAPAALADPDGANPIGSLVAGPVEHALLTLAQSVPEGLDEDARQAEQTARSSAPADSSTGANPGTTPGSTTSHTNPVTRVTTQSTKPLTDVVTGLSSARPLPEAVKRLTRPVTDATKPVTGLVDGLLGGLSGKN